MRMTGEELYAGRAEWVLCAVENEPSTNMELAKSLCLTYRIVQRVTKRLEKEGLIQGHVNQWGVRSNTTWSLSPLQNCRDPLLDAELSTGAGWVGV